MAHFTQDFIDFFTELAENNHKEWFDINRKRYEKSVKEPFKAFVNEIISRVNEDDPEVRIEAKDAIFRINRDIRFAKDKTPYKTSVSAIVSRGGRKDKTSPGLYFELKPASVRVYGGAHQLEKDQLQDVREFIVSNMDEFNGALQDNGFKKRFETVRGEQNKRIPVEFREVVETQPLIANKAFYYYCDIDPKLITSDKLVDEVMAAYNDSKPMMGFLKDAMGID